MPHSTTTGLRKVRTALVVVVITFLIWFAADQFVLMPEKFVIPVRVVSADSNRYAALADAPFQRVSVEMRGRRRRLREFGEAVKAAKAQGDHFVVDIDASRPTSPEPQAISTLDDVLLRLEEFRGSRLTINEVEPERLMVRIDDYVTRSVPVKPDYGDLKVNHQLSPEKVRVRLPRFAYDRLSARVATPMVEDLVRDASRSDGTFEVQTKLVLKDVDPNIVEFLDSDDVKISGNILASTETRNLGPIQIKWFVPDEVQKEYTMVAEQDNFRVFIDVTGPTDRISHLDPAGIRGLVDVLAGDVNAPGPGLYITRRVTFILPPGFSDCSIAPESQDQEIRFQLLKRSGNAIAGGQD